MRLKVVIVGLQLKNRFGMHCDMGSQTVIIAKRSRLPM